MMDFKNAKELLHLCEEAGSSISDIMLKREIELGEISEIEALARMEKAFHIMRDSARTPVKTPVKSMGRTHWRRSEKVIRTPGSRKRSVRTDS